MERSYSGSSTTPHDHDHDPNHEPCVECDVTGFDDLQCDGEGVTAEAEYLGEHREQLTERRSQFDGARTNYEAARNAAAEHLTWIDRQLARIRDQIECQLSEERRGCLDEAWEHVRRDLESESCGGDTACCAPENCDFELDLDEDATSADIQALIDRFDKLVEKAESCFDALIGEPEALADRITTLRDYVEQLATAVCDTDAPDFEHAYAKLLWAEYRRNTIWLRFDAADDYVDCLCRALNCSLKGRRALAKLAGMLATIECREQREHERCNWLREHVVEEVLAKCRRLRPPDTYDKDEGHEQSAG